MPVSFVLNGEPVSIEVESEMPLLWVLRDVLSLTGTKYGCGIGACGACTVHLNGTPVRSCSIPVGALEGVHLTTIEGLGSQDELHVVQQSWIEHQVPQCGYCQCGMLMAVAALLRVNPTPSDDDIDTAITNICRCGTYNRIRAAVHAAADKLKVS